jgi:hypothetical protein
MEADQVVDANVYCANWWPGGLVVKDQEQIEWEKR